MNSYLIPDDPIVSCIERTGMPPWQQQDPRNICPVCGGECETLYVDRNSREVIGCDECIEAEDVWDYVS